MYKYVKTYSIYISTYRRGLWIYEFRFFSYYLHENREDEQNLQSYFFVFLYFYRNVRCYGSIKLTDHHNKLYVCVCARFRTVDNLMLHSTKNSLCANLFLFSPNICIRLSKNKWFEQQQQQEKVPTIRFSCLECGTSICFIEASIMDYL